jgi:hypothetical protein
MREKHLPLIYKGVRIDCAYRIDIIWLKFEFFDLTVKKFHGYCKCKKLLLSIREALKTLFRQTLYQIEYHRNRVPLFQR